jgi:hypothetical protein
MPNGVSWPVYFGVGSADIDKIVEGSTGKKHQGQLLNERYERLFRNTGTCAKVSIIEN